jgi:hypothetical protein
MSQIKILHSGKTFFTSVNEEGWPGAIQIWKFPLEKVNEIQAHASGIERMCLTFDNKTLITAA